jgi:uncharacterized protein
MAVLLRRAIAVAAVVIGLFAPTVALAYVPPPIRGHVNDTAGKLGAADVASLEAKLEGVRKQTGHELVVFLLPTLGGETIEDVAYGTFNGWKLGRKGVDDGVLLVIAPAERKVRIETGKGVGGALTDLQANDIIRTKIAPSLKQERFREAIERGTDAIAAALGPGGATGAAPPTKSVGDRVEETVGAVLVLLIGFFFLAALFGAIRDVLSGKRPARSTGSSWSSSSDYSSSSSSDYSSSSSSSSDSSYSGGGGESGGGGSSDSY